ARRKRAGSSTASCASCCSRRRKWRREAGGTAVDNVIKVIAIGDVHGQWPELWRVLKASAACTPTLEPTAAVLEGRYQVVCIGDLVHYKDERAYAVAVGEEPYDSSNPDHLRRAAKA